MTFQSIFNDLILLFAFLLAGFAVHIEERNDHNPPAWEHRDVVRARL